MHYAIQLLEKEKRTLENKIRSENLMYNDMKQATRHLKNITELKRAIKTLKARTRIFA